MHRWYPGQFRISGIVQRSMYGMATKTHEKNRYVKGAKLFIDPDPEGRPKSTFENTTSFLCPHMSKSQKLRLFLRKILCISIYIYINFTALMTKKLRWYISPECGFWTSARSSALSLTASPTKGQSRLWHETTRTKYHWSRGYFNDGFAPFPPAIRAIALVILVLHFTYPIRVTIHVYWRKVSR